MTAPIAEDDHDLESEGPRCPNPYCPERMAVDVRDWVECAECERLRTEEEESKCPVSRSRRRVKDVLYRRAEDRVARRNTSSFISDRDVSALLDHIATMASEIERLREEVTEKANWIGNAVASCAKRQCSMRDQQIRDLEAEVSTLTSDLATARAELTEARRMLAASDPLSGVKFPINPTEPF